MEEAIIVLDDGAASDKKTAQAPAATTNNTSRQGQGLVLDLSDSKLPRFEEQCDTKRGSLLTNKSTAEHQKVKDTEVSGDLRNHQTANDAKAKDNQFGKKRDSQLAPLTNRSNFHVSTYSSNLNSEYDIRLHKKVFIPLKQSIESKWRRKITKGGIL